LADQSIILQKITQHIAFATTDNNFYWSESRLIWMVR